MDKVYIEKVVNLTLDWCKNKFNGPEEKPLLVLGYNPTKYLGLFMRASNDQALIFVYPNQCKTITKIVKTTIHEYKHFLQFSNYEEFLKYTEVSKKFEYDENPYEVECRLFEEENYKKCYRHVLNKCGKKNFMF